MNKLYVILIIALLQFFIVSVKTQDNDSILLNDSTSFSPVLKSQSSGIFDMYISAPANVTYPTPTSTALQKFLGYPVSPATGLIDISIPLYELKLREFSIPFQLKYHSSGIKQQDMPGFTGYGWTLFPGCKITRTIMGKPDDKYPTKYARNYFENPTMEQLINTATPASLNDLQGTFIPGEDDPNDGQYDIFSVHLPNINTTFILEYDNNTNNYTALPIPESPVKIIPYYDAGMDLRLYRFEVIDEQGVKYFFGEANPVPRISWRLADYKFIESTSDNEFYSNTTSWMLEKIVFPNCMDSIVFTYESHSEQPMFYNCSLTIVDNGNAISYNPHAIGEHGAIETLTGEEGYFESRSERKDHFYYLSALSKIQTSDLQIIFNYDKYENYYSYLSSMKVFSNTDLETPIKSVLFETRFPGFLDRIHSSGIGSYNFDYYEFNSDFANPYYIVSSMAIDWWGYFNGRSQEITGNNLSNIRLEIYSHKPAFSTHRTAGGVNREPHAEYMKLKSLKRITYPTGGTFNIRYKPHQIGNRIGGGLRVDSIISYDSLSNKKVVTYYEYERPQFTGQHYPDEKTHVSRDKYLCKVVYGPFTALDPSFIGPIAEVEARIRTVSTFSPHAYFTQTILPVWYEKVTEYSNENKTIYEFSFQPDNNTNMIGGYEYYPLQIFRLLYPAPFMTKRELYKKTSGAYHLLQRETNDYSNPYNTPIEGVLAIPYRFFANTYNQSTNSSFLGVYSTGTYADLFGNPIIHLPYYLYQGKINLIETTKEIFPENGSNPVIEKVFYHYDDNHPYNLIEKTMQINDEESLIENYYYPTNTIPDMNILTSSQQSVISLMNENNYKTTLIQQTLKKGNTALYSKLTGYKAYTAGNNQNMFLPEVQYYKKGTFPYEKRLEFLEYDLYGNPAHIRLNESSETVYLWGYNGKYPLAEIKNATYNQVKNHLGEHNYINELTSKLQPAESDFTKINNLRNPPFNASMENYTYMPFIGMTSKTLFNGTSTYYNYDYHGRLASVFDHNHEKTAEYKYNYVSNPASTLPPISLYPEFETEGSTTKPMLFEMYAEGGNGEFLYHWEIKKESTGEIIYSKMKDTSNELYYLPTHTGEMEITCKVKDLISGEEKSYIASFTVYNQIIQFGNIEGLGGYGSRNYFVTANIFCSEPTVVEFKIAATLGQMEVIEMVIGDYFDEQVPVPSNSLSLQLSTGQNIVVISILNLIPTHDDVSLKIISASASDGGVNTIGENNELRISRH